MILTARRAPLLRPSQLGPGLRRGTEAYASKSRVSVDLDRRIAVILTSSSGKRCRATGRVVRTLAYKGFAVLFDDAGTRAVGDFIKAMATLPQEGRVAFLSTELKPEIEIF